MVNKHESIGTNLHKERYRPYWDWSRESPVELILVTFILLVFFLMPHNGCGISESSAGQPTPTEVTGHPG